MSSFVSSITAYINQLSHCHNVPEGVIVEKKEGALPVAKIPRRTGSHDRVKE